MTILVIAEHNHNELSPATLSTITAAQKLSGDVDILLLGDKVSHIQGQLQSIPGVTSVITCDHPRLKHAISEDMVPTILKALDHKIYSHILAPATTFGKNPIPTRGGGSIPIIALFEKVLGLKTVLMGFGLDNDNIHSPNEKYDVVNFYKGIETTPHFHQNFAEMSK